MLFPIILVQIKKYFSITISTFFSLCFTREYVTNTLLALAYKEPEHRLVGLQCNNKYFYYFICKKFFMAKAKFLGFFPQKLEAQRQKKRRNLSPSQWQNLKNFKVETGRKLRICRLAEYLVSNRKRVFLTPLLILNYQACRLCRGLDGRTQRLEKDLKKKA